MTLFLLYIIIVFYIRNVADCSQINLFHKLSKFSTQSTSICNKNIVPEQGPCSTNSLCANGLYCDPLDSKCKKLLQLGDNCLYTEQCNGYDTLCLTSGSKKICKRQVAVGQPCENDVDCFGNSVCSIVAPKVCKSYTIAVDKEPCSNDLNQLKFCASLDLCNNGTCSLLSKGQPCSDDGQCNTLFCNGKCEDPPAIGSPCSNTSIEGYCQSSTTTCMDNKCFVMGSVQSGLAPKFKEECAPDLFYDPQTKRCADTINCVRNEDCWDNGFYLDVLYTTYNSSRCCLGKCRSDPFYTICANTLKDAYTVAPTLPIRINLLRNITWTSWPSSREKSILESLLKCIICAQGSQGLKKESGRYICDKSVVSSSQNTSYGFQNFCIVLLILINFLI